MWKSEKRLYSGVLRLYLVFNHDAVWCICVCHERTRDASFILYAGTSKCGARIAYVKYSVPLAYLIALMCGYADTDLPPPTGSRNGRSAR